MSYTSPMSFDSIRDNIHVLCERLLGTAAPSQASINPPNFNERPLNDDELIDLVELDDSTIARLLQPASSR
jgi:hypothetical protein